MTRIGTNHFATIGQANAYYFNMGFSFEDVQEKLRVKEIEIGKPKAEGKILIDKDGRYHIES